MIWLLIGIIALPVVTQMSLVIGIEYYQLNKNTKLIDSFKINHQNSKTLVVYFSRAGKTELMAYKITRPKL